MKLAAYYSRLTHYSAPVDGLGGSSTGTYMLLVSPTWTVPRQPYRAVPCRTVYFYSSWPCAREASIVS